MQDYSYLLYNDLKQIIKDVYNAQNPTDTIGGLVLSTDPLSITTDKQQDPIPSSLVIVPAAYGVREYEDVTLEITEGRADVIGTEEPAYVDLAGVTLKGKLTFDNSLKVDDSVLMVKSQDGQRFIVIGKG